MFQFQQWSCGTGGKCLAASHPDSLKMSLFHSSLGNLNKGTQWKDTFCKNIAAYQKLYQLWSWDVDTCLINIKCKVPKLSQYVSGTAEDFRNLLVMSIFNFPHIFENVIKHCIPQMYTFPITKPYQN